jgi:hypothetical protein
LPQFSSFYFNFSSIYLDDLWVFSLDFYLNVCALQVSLSSELNMGMGRQGFDSSVHLGVLYKYQTFRLQVI